MHPNTRLVLADGTCFEGIAFGHLESTVGEVVFNTGMTGYQEVLSDPSYCRQIVVMTAPHIGNTGVNQQDNEASTPALSALAIHSLAPLTSNWRCDEELDRYCLRHNIRGIAGIDTRALTRHIRDHGAQMAALGNEDRATLHDRARAEAPMEGRDLVCEVSTAQTYEWTEDLGDWQLEPAVPPQTHVVAIDFGIKHNILRCLRQEGCRVTVVPAATSAEDILALKPDGVFLSNGPGDPAAVSYAVNNVQQLLGKKPIFGICLGHQVLCLALGSQSYKLKFGHHGLNQPVRDLATGAIEITSQNHGFAIDIESMKGKCEMTHVNLNDQTCEGVLHRESGAFGVQYHPEAGAGPHDSRYLFRRFVGHMRDNRPY